MTLLFNGRRVTRACVTIVNTYEDNAARPLKVTGQHQEVETVDADGKIKVTYHALTDQLVFDEEPERETTTDGAHA